MIHSLRLFLLVLPLALLACGGTTIPTDPVKEMKKKFESKMAYTILLSDMDLVDNQYKHKYKIFELLPDSSVAVSTTDWEDVNDDFFLLHETDLGMEVLSKTPDGSINNLVTPPGFTNFIGNKQFGYWTVENERMFWKFHPEFDYLNADLGLSNMQIRREEFDEFTARYYLNRPFYGEITSVDSTKYGTYSHFSVIRWPSFYTRKAEKKNFEKDHYSTVYSDDRGGGGTGK